MAAAFFATFFTAAPICQMCISFDVHLDICLDMHLDMCRRVVRCCLPGCMRRAVVSARGVVLAGIKKGMLALPCFCLEGGHYRMQAGAAERGHYGRRFLNWWAGDIKGKHRRQQVL